MFLAISAAVERAGHRPGLLLEEVKQHRVTGHGYDSHGAADRSTHDPLSSGGFQSCDFIQDLFSPALANLVSTLADGIGFCGVIVDPVEDPDISQFVVEFCQHLVARHIVNPQHICAQAQTDENLALEFAERGARS